MSVHLIIPAWLFYLHFGLSLLLVGISFAGFVWLIYRKISK